MDNSTNNQKIGEIESIVSKNKKKLLLYLIFVVALFAVIIILYFKYIEAQNHIVIINEQNQKNVMELSSLKNKTFIEVESLTQIIDSLGTKNDSLINQLSVAQNISVDSTLIYNRKKKELEIQLIKNSEYLIGAYSYKTTKEEDNKIANYLLNYGYTVEGKEFLNYGNYEPSWMSKYPAVFYYTSSSKSKAKKIAQQLTELTGKVFKIRSGYGLGVIKGQEAVTFFVHNVPK